MSAARVARHVASAYEVQIVELSSELPACTLREEPDRLVVSSSGERKLAAQFVSDVIARRACSEDVIFGFYAGTWAHPLWLTSRWVGAPLVLFARGNDVDLEPFGSDGAKVLAALDEARGVVCVTRELERKVRAWAPRANARYVPNGVDTERFSRARMPTRERGSRVRLGMFGDIKSKKGFDLLLAAFDPERFELRIVGELRPEAEKILHGVLTVEPAWARSITHHPFVATEEELLEHYAQIDVVCLPSTHEGMSNVMLEAMSLEKVVVASRVGGALDVIKDGESGILFEPFDERALGRALDRAEVALSDDGDAMGRVARRAVEGGFTVHAERTRIVTALGELLD